MRQEDTTEGAMVAGFKGKPGQGGSKRPAGEKKGNERREWETSGINRLEGKNFHHVLTARRRGIVKRGAGLGLMFSVDHASFMVTLKRYAEANQLSQHRKLRLWRTSNQTQIQSSCLWPHAVLFKLKMMIG